MFLEEEAVLDASLCDTDVSPLIISQMPKFELKPVDGGNIVHLPEGETVLGRGPLFGVSFYTLL